MQTSIPWCRVSVFVTERMTLIHSLKGTVFIFTGELAVIYCLSNTFNSQQYYVYFHKKLVHAFLQRYHSIHSHPSFKDTAYFSDVRFRSYPILPTHFLSSYFRTPGIVKQTYYQRSYIFSAASIILKRVQLLEAATFSREDFFWRYICLKQLLLSNNCFLVTYTFFNQLFLADRYFFSTTTTSEELLLQNK